MSAGYSGTPSWRKLGIKEGHQVATAGAPTHFGALLDPLPASVLLRPDLRARGPFDVLVVFVRTEAELRSRFSRARNVSIRSADCGWRGRNEALPSPGI